MWTHHFYAFVLKYFANLMLPSNAWKVCCEKFTHNYTVSWKQKLFISKRLETTKCRVCNIWQVVIYGNANVWILLYINNAYKKMRKNSNHIVQTSYKVRMAVSWLTKFHELRLRKYW